MLKTVIHQNIDEIKSEEWDLLAKESSAFYDHGWFKSFNHLLGKAIFIAAYEQDRLVGLLPCFIVSNTREYLYHNPKDALLCRNEIDLSQFIFRLGKYKSWFVLNCISKFSKIFEPVLNKMIFPACICISPRGFVGDCLYENELVLQNLLNALNEICKKNSIRTKCFMWVSKENHKLISHLKSADFNSLIGEMDFNIDIKWKDFNEFMGSLNRLRKWRFKKDIKNIELHAYSIKFNEGIDYVSSHIDQISELAQKHAVACGDLLSVHDIKETYQRTLGNMKDKIYTITAMDDKSEIIGFCIGFRKNDKLYPKFEGYDPVMSRKMGIHHNLVYYSHVLNAIERNQQKVHFGAGDPQSKLSRGCTAVPLLCFYDFKNRLSKKVFTNYLVAVNKFKENIYNSIDYTLWKKP